VISNSNQYILDIWSPRRHTLTCTTMQVKLSRFVYPMDG